MRGGRGSGRTWGMWSPRGLCRPTSFVRSYLGRGKKDVGKEGRKEKGESEKLTDSSRSSRRVPALKGESCRGASKKTTTVARTGEGLQKKDQPTKILRALKKQIAKKKSSTTGDTRPLERSQERAKRGGLLGKKDHREDYLNFGTFLKESSSAT